MCRRFICSLPGRLALLVCLAMLVPPARAGNGTFNNGVYGFCVSVRFNATAVQLANIQTAFDRANRIFADALDGKQRWGTIKIVNSSGCTESAEFWVNPGSGRAYATLDKYGVRGQHVMLFYNGQANGGADDLDNPTQDGVAYMIAHEMSHHAFGLCDEYSGPGIGETAHCAKLGELPTLNYSLMDNFFTRGGRSGGGSTYTLKEFCVKSNHDPDGVNYQTAFHHQSARETIAAHPTRSATPPRDLPDFTSPVVLSPAFQSSQGGLRAMVVIDQSGSMADDNKLNYAKLAASLFVGSLQTGDQVGVIAFGDGSTVTYPLTQITGSSVQNAVIAAINNIQIGGNTNIGDGLNSALNQIARLNPRSCNELIVLLTDGDYNTGPDPMTVAPAIALQGVTVLTVGVGSGISDSGQSVLQSVAARTGGKYFGLSSSFGLLALFFQMWAEGTGNGLLTRAPLTLGPSVSQSTSVLVEPGSQSITFGVSISNSAAVSISLQAPNGAVYSSDGAVAAAGGSVNRTIPNIVLFTFPNPQSGSWRLTALASSATNIEVFAGSVNNAVKLMVSTDLGTVRAPYPITLQATPEFGGANLVRASVTGVVIRPDGTTIPVTLMDDGSPSSGDAQANDGIYAARFSAYNANGTYTVQLTATGSALFAQGESFGAALGNPQPAPAFMRVSTSSFIVTGVDPCAARPAELVLNTPVAASLGRFSCLSDGNYFGIYTFAGAAGQAISISLDSNDFDAFLFLADPSGKIIATDDDGGPGSNARIPGSSGLFTLPVTGVYVVFATSYESGGTGAYTLVVNGSPATCAFSISPSSQNFTASGGTGTVNVTSNGAACTRTATSNASWIAVTSGASGAGSGAIAYSVAANSGAAHSGTLTIAGQTFTVVQAAAIAAPAFVAAGVVNAASYGGGGVSAGEIVTIFGSALGPSILAQFSLVNNAIPLQLSGMTVTFDGVPAPVLYTSATAASVVVPYAVAGKSQTTVQVQYAGQKSVPVIVPVIPAVPGLFTANASGGGQGAILNQDTSYNSAAIPAAKGSIVILYATGEGQTSPGGIDGKLALTSPLPQPVLPVSVTVGGQQAEILYAGAAPIYLAGLMQINARIPLSVGSGAQPVAVTVGNSASKAGVTVAVR